MEIEKINFPRLLAGEITRMAVTEASHVYVEGLITIRGIKWRWSCHFHLWANGQWEIGIESDNSYNRSYSLHAYHESTHENFTPAAKSKAVSIILPTFREWAYANAPAFEEAQAAHIEDAIEKREEQIKAHKEAISNLEAEIDDLMLGDDLGTYSKVKHYTFELGK